MLTVSNINEYYTHPGVSIVRINADTLGTLPPSNNKDGYVVSLFPEYNSTALQCRQTFYPDSLTESSPYTRTGTITRTNNVISAITWGQWSTLGGGMLQTALTTNNTIGIPNNLYYSHGNYTLKLPDPSDYPLGTKIGLIQFAGTGSVVCESQSQAIVTKPEKGWNINSSGAAVETNTYKGGYVYLFEVCNTPTAETGTNTKQWVLEDDESDITEAMVTLNDVKEKITVHQVKVNSGTHTITDLSKHYHLYVTTSCTIVIPDAIEANLGTTITIEIVGPKTVTIRNASNSADQQEEVVGNASSSTLFILQISAINQNDTVVYKWVNLIV